jgi:hypothetical protein
MALYTVHGQLDGQFLRALFLILTFRTSDICPADTIQSANVEGKKVLFGGEDQFMSNYYMVQFKKQPESSAATTCVALVRTYCGENAKELVKCLVPGATTEKAVLMEDAAIVFENARIVHCGPVRSRTIQRATPKTGEIRASALWPWL